MARMDHVTDYMILWGDVLPSYIYPQQEKERYIHIHTHTDSNAAVGIWISRMHVWEDIVPHLFRAPLI